MLAVPGEITSALSRGTNALLRLGATPVTGAADVLEAIGLDPAEPATASRRPGRTPPPSSPRSTRAPRRRTRSSRATGLAPAAAAAALAELELAGLVDGARRGVQEVMPPP